MTAFAILLAGDVVPTDRLRRQIAGTRVIAADSGIRHAAILTVTPELWVGDFDSADDGDHDEHRQVPRLTFPASKDRTDGEIAIEEAQKRGAKSLLLVGAFGGRTDQAVGHMAMAIRLGQQGYDVRLTSGREEAIPLGPAPVTMTLAPHIPFSVLGFGDLEGLTLEGVRWPLSGVDIPFGSTLTLSNIAEGPVTASVAKGLALLIAQVGSRTDGE